MCKKGTRALRHGLVSALIALCMLATPRPAHADVARKIRPNVLVIVADDLAFSDIGVFGGEINTPNLNALAKRGQQLTNFYTTPTCSPTRAMLLTGIDHHQVGLGTMAERMAPQQRGRFGYEGYLTSRAPTIAERLRSTGYRTLMAGKWHLGLTPETAPSARGFQRSFALLHGAHNHFGFDQDRAHEAAGAQTLYREDDRVVRFPVGAFSSDYFTDRMIGFLEEDKDPGRPFFAYLAFSAPHWPLQAPDRDIAKYRGKYVGGPEQLRERRILRMKRLKVISRLFSPYPFEGPKWLSLPAGQRTIEAAKMETYAAMVDNLDQNVGRLLDTLRRSGRLENTLVIFLSDNGPDGGSFDRPVNVNDPSKPLSVPFDNSAANIGRPNSHVSYGYGWAQAGAAPFRGIKGSVAEGGIHSPAIIAGPGVIPGTSDAVVNVGDIYPTILDAASLPLVVPTFNQCLTPEGKSLVKLLEGNISTVRQMDDPLNWELFFQRAARRGNLKAAFFAESHSRWAGKGKPLSQTRWQLFDLDKDPGETNDIAATRPNDLNQLINQWDAYARNNGVVIPTE